MIPVGLTRDAGWRIGVSRTVPQDADRVWDALLSPEGLAVWLGPGAVLGDEPGAPFTTHDGGTGELRSLRPGDRVRVTWTPAGRASRGGTAVPGSASEALERAPATTVQVVVRSTATGTSIRLHQERLADADEREAMRQHWAGVHERLAALLNEDGTPGPGG